jgi:type II secretory pathway pseudopilin PulG
MKRSICVAGAFSLVEVTLALGIAAFCLIAVFGLLPIGVQTNRNATSQTAATNIMAAVAADLRATPGCAKSVQFGIQFGTPTTLYFDGQGQSSCDSAGLQKYQYNPLNCLASTCSGSWSPALQLRYRLNVTWNSSGWNGLRYADVKVTWPAPVDPATITPSGSAEMFVAFDRN